MSILEPEEKNPSRSNWNAALGMFLKVSPLYRALPFSARHLFESAITRQGSVGKEDLDQEMNTAIYRAAQNAIKRTGKTSGGIEYIDYGADIHKKLQNLQGTPWDILFNAKRDPRYNAATTLGRFSYKVEGGNLIVTDNYDFNKIGDHPSAWGQLRCVIGDATGSVGLGEGADNPIRIEYNIKEWDRLSSERDVYQEKPNDITKSIIDTGNEIGNAVIQGAEDLSNEAYKFGTGIYNTIMK